MPSKRNGKRAPPRKRRSKNSGKVSAVVKSYINRTIRRNQETKMSSNQYGLTAFNSTITANADLITVLPTITVGTGQNDRIGNKIRPIRLEITGYVAYYTDALTANQDARMLGARLFCFQDKTTRSYANSINNFNLLNLGGTGNNFTGTALNWVSPHNNEQFTFYADKKFVVQKPFGFTNNTTPSSTNAITGMDKTLFHPFKIVLTQKQLPAVLQYDQGDSLSYPTNFAPFMALGYCDLMNKTPDTSSTQLVMEFNATLYYKDS